MEFSVRHTTIARRYRLVKGLAIMGLLVLGLLLLEVLASATGYPLLYDLRTMSEREASMLAAGDAGFRATAMIVAVAAMMLATLGGFVASERRTVRRNRRREHLCRRKGVIERIDKLSATQRVSVFLTRMMLFTGALLLTVVMQDLYLQYVVNGIEGMAQISTGVPSTMFLALSVFVATFVTLISMHGMTVLTGLRELRTMLEHACRKIADELPERLSALWWHPTLQQRFGDILFGRPPPSRGWNGAVVVTSTAR